MHSHPHPFLLISGVVRPIGHNRVLFPVLSLEEEEEEEVLEEEEGVLEEVLLLEEEVLVSEEDLVSAHHPSPEPPNRTETVSLPGPQAQTTVPSSLLSSSTSSLPLFK